MAHCLPIQIYCWYWYFLMCIMEPRVSAVVTIGHWEQKLSIGMEFCGCERSLEVLQLGGRYFIFLFVLHWGKYLSTIADVLLYLLEWRVASSSIHKGASIQPGFIAYSPSFHFISITFSYSCRSAFSYQHTIYL